ncbi:nuclear transport factor 2 family protein [Amycolatopsis sp. FDAARGOS 1241]|uniref:nuclear transport factor 2 family protein n=1 Tax=Amycolatopsis sp. FDAARGOS 1241 TaxID=2778070 RepID=UPI00194FF824|nr:nuclear transport factor 2 family protein [Amycolatopsis sp. FDAARGOS 1241]QRP48216.1 nuclear transport factor 2 family protein [Amycolatopsis sp. FDAARGOS 1241]
MGVEVSWDADAEQSPARLAAFRSMTAVAGGDKDGWLALFAPDAVVEDPVGPSMFDEQGKGHHGREGIGAFWDLTIAHVERFEFVIRDSFAAGSECANVGTITTFLPGGYRVDTDGVFVYRVGEDGSITSMRAFWETERAMATARQV